jgi:hypothetical protein
MELRAEVLAKPAGRRAVDGAMEEVPDPADNGVSAKLFNIRNLLDRPPPKENSKRKDKNRTKR